MFYLKLFKYTITFFKFPEKLSKCGNFFEFSSIFFLRFQKIRLKSFQILDNAYSFRRLASFHVKTITSGFQLQVKPINLSNPARPPPIAPFRYIGIVDLCLIRCINVSVKLIKYIDTRSNVKRSFFDLDENRPSKTHAIRHGKYLSTHIHKYTYIQFIYNVLIQN